MENVTDTKPSNLMRQLACMTTLCKFLQTDWGEWCQYSWSRTCLFSFSFSFLTKREWRPLSFYLYVLGKKETPVVTYSHKAISIQRHSYHPTWSPQFGRYVLASMHGWDVEMHGPMSFDAVSMSTTWVSTLHTYQRGTGSFPEVDTIQHL